MSLDRADVIIDGMWLRDVVKPRGQLEMLVLAKDFGAVLAWSATLSLLTEVFAQRLRPYRPSPWQIPG